MALCRWPNVDMMPPIAAILCAIAYNNLYLNYIF